MPVEALYFVNPMCSWCWGFAPSLAAAQEALDLRVTLALGSLGDRGGRPMRAEDKRYVREHWEHVGERSGQPFDFAFFDRESFVYDTVPACRAVALARSLDAGRALAFLHAVQRAFYAESRDVTSLGTLAELAVLHGYDGDAFAAGLGDPALHDAVEAEFVEVANMGVTGYPTLVALHDGRARLVAHGWRSPAELVDTLTGFASDPS